ncbi:unnamed protein product [Cylicocyclus nassatus]|uniref:Uncharacterized protein n=1 Tax=Cylicocyclus nassatus TaxID=53992 RepID=A0AA36DP21_CYLNA|nr:unnamed protein product [Cylicocyclus nassatus]
MPGFERTACLIGSTSNTDIKCRLRASRNLSRRHASVRFHVRAAVQMSLLIYLAYLHCIIKKTDTAFNTQ